MIIGKTQGGISESSYFSRLFISLTGGESESQKMSYSWGVVLPLKCELFA